MLVSTVSATPAVADSSTSASATVAADADAATAAVALSCEPVFWIFNVAANKTHTKKTHQAKETENI